MNLPLELLDIIASFLPGDTLLDFSCTCVDLWRRIDERSQELWKRVVRVDPALDPECTADVYDHDWRALYLDRNKKNHTLLLEFSIPHSARHSEERVFSSWVTHEGYAYRIIVDPLGNYMVDVPRGSAVSVYVECRPEPDRTHWGRVVKFRLSLCGTEWWSSTVRLHESLRSWGSHSLVPCTTLTADKRTVVQCRLQFPYARVHLAGTQQSIDCPLAWSLQDVRQILQASNNEPWWIGEETPLFPVSPEMETECLHTLLDHHLHLETSRTLTVWPEQPHRVFLRHVVDSDTEWVSTRLSIPTILRLWPDAEIHRKDRAQAPVVVLLHAPRHEIRDRLLQRLGRVGHLDRSWVLDQLLRLYPEIPFHRIHKVLNEDHASLHQAVPYILQGRHLGYICDGCAALDFIGTRHHCTVCEDYDLCDDCIMPTTRRHRYSAGRKRVFPFLDHHTTHPFECTTIQSCCC